MSHDFYILEAGLSFPYKMACLIHDHNRLINKYVTFLTVREQSQSSALL